MWRVWKGLSRARTCARTAKTKDYAHRQRARGGLFTIGIAEEASCGPPHNLNSKIHTIILHNAIRHLSSGFVCLLHTRSGGIHRHVPSAWAPAIAASRVRSKISEFARQKPRIARLSSWKTSLRDLLESSFHWLERDLSAFEYTHFLPPPPLALLPAAMLRRLGPSSRRRSQHQFLRQRTEPPNQKSGLAAFLCALLCLDLLYERVHHNFETLEAAPESQTQQATERRATNPYQSHAVERGRRRHCTEERVRRSRGAREVRAEWSER